MIDFRIGDCMEAMDLMAHDEFDLAIVDPPYGIGENGSRNKTRGRLAKAKDYKSFHGDDIDSPEKVYFDQLLRVSKNQIIFGANHFISKIPFDSPAWIVWDKNNGESDFADCELAWTSFGISVRKFSFTWNGMIQGNMKEKEFRIHPTQKPVALYQWILMNYADPGARILDTHAGSGSLAVACHRLGFDYLGFEIDAEYHAAARKRIDEEMSQMRLFT